MFALNVKPRLPQTTDWHPGDAQVLTGDGWVRVDGLKPAHLIVTVNTMADFHALVQMGPYVEAPDKMERDVL